MKESFKMDIELSEELQNQVTKVVPIVFLPDGSKQMIGTSNKTQNGFGLNLQDPLNPTFLYPLRKYANFMHGEIDNDVMCYGSVDFYAYNENKYIGTLKKSYYYVDSSENKNDEVSYFLHLMYVTDDATISGSKIIDGKPLASYDVKLKKGWNFYITIQTIHYTAEGTHDYTSHRYVSEIPDNLSWQL